MDSGNNDIFRQKTVGARSIVPHLWRQSRLPSEKVEYASVLVQLAGGTQITLDACYHRQRPFGTKTLPAIRWGKPVSKLSIASLTEAFLCTLIPATALGQGSNLPLGAGKALVKTTCLGCHKANRITLVTIKRPARTQ